MNTDATGSSYGQVRVTSSMPAKKRLAVEYRRTTPQEDGDDRKPSFCSESNRWFAGSPATTTSLCDTGPESAGGYHNDVRKCMEGGRVVVSGDTDQSAVDLQANKVKVLGLIAAVLTSGESNEEKERKLGDIIADLETVRKTLVEQKAAHFKVLTFRQISVVYLYSEGEVTSLT